MPSLISIVIPTYGRDAVLCDTVASLLSLTVPANELLVVDQTSEHDRGPNARLTAWDLAGAIRWIRHQPPGVVGAMNRGLREAKGDIVLFLDDDIVPDGRLVTAHRQAYVEHPEAWAVVGQVVQEENVGEKAETLKAEKLKKRQDWEPGGQGADVGSSQELKVISVFQYFSISAFRSKHVSALSRDLDFRFNDRESGWVENVMAGNLSVRREKALAIGGYDEKFMPPVSYRFETDFAKRIVKAGGKIWFEPAASIRHLREARGGTRCLGSHMASASPLHGMGDYYYALKHGRGWERIRYMARRPFREVCTKFHLRHPWWIPLKFIGEMRALVLGCRLYRAGAILYCQRDDARAFYDVQYAGSRYAAYAEPARHPFFAELNRLLDRHGGRNGKWLEVGCGRGLLQDVVDDYTGVDLSSTVETFLHKPFCCASAEALPFDNETFDGVWSYAVLEHVHDPEETLLEIRRILKSGGILFLAPAWQCRPWASCDYAWKHWRDLSFSERIRKLVIPVRESVLFRSFSVFPRRLLHLLMCFGKSYPIRFFARPMKPNYSDYKVIDADARHHMDPYDAILWFRSRGDRVLSHHGWIRQYFVRAGVLVIQIRK